MTAGARRFVLAMGARRGAVTVRAEAFRGGRRDTTEQFLDVEMAPVERAELGKGALVEHPPVREEQQGSRRASPRKVASRGLVHPDLPGRSSSGLRGHGRDLVHQGDAVLPHPPLHTRLGQRQLQLFVLHPRPPLLRRPLRSGRAAGHFVEALVPASRNACFHLPTDDVLTPRSRAASAALSSPDSDGSCLRVR